MGRIDGRRRAPERRGRGPHKAPGGFPPPPLLSTFWRKPRQTTPPLLSPPPPCFRVCLQPLPGAATPPPPSPFTTRPGPPHAPLRTAAGLESSSTRLKEIEANDRPQRLPSVPDRPPDDRLSDSCSPRRITSRSAFPIFVFASGVKCPSATKFRGSVSGQMAWV